MIALAIFMPTVSADFLPVQVYATDTVAGYPSALRTSLVDPYQDVRFVVEKPDGAVIQIPAQADMDGVAKTDFFGHQTKIAGSYRSAVVYPGSDNSSPQSIFTVYPDSVSASQSSLRSTVQMVEAGSDVTFLVVTLYDQYRNPIKDHLVKLISSRPEDSIEVLQEGVTDQNGRTNFKVTSNFPGVSVFTAMDVTMNQVLSDREEVVFFTPVAPKVSNNSFIDLLKADIGGDGDVLPGPVDHFSIQGLPSTVKVGEQLSMTVVAQDNDNNTAKNYTGTILISVPEDDNAILPSNGEYTFKASDQGKFTFDLSLEFTKLGNQVVQIFDKSSFKIAGEYSIEVVPEQSVVQSPTSDDIMIKSPGDGSELGSNLVILTGQGNENINLKVFDNDVKIGDTETDADGFFSFEVQNLESSVHVFYVMTENSEVSKAITVTIDTLPPVLNSFEMDVDGPVVPGTQVSISLTSEPGLEEAKVRVQGVEEFMNETDPGTYEVTVVSPVQDGQFPVDVILLDSLSNRGEFTNKGIIEVLTPKPNSPPQVEGLEGIVGDSFVQLEWTSLESHERPVQHYRLYYGAQMESMDQTMDTQDDTPAWELRGLNNETQYFIAVTAVDSQGLESEEKSVTIAVTPIAPDLCENIQCGDYGVCSEGVCECDEGWSGLTCNIEPEPEVPVVDSNQNQNPVFDPNNNPYNNPFSGSTVNQIQAIPFDSSVSLSWPQFPGVQAYYYRISMGFAPMQYNDSIVTADNRTSATVYDLINNVPYYFSVAALDVNGQQISPLSQEVLAMPSGAGFRPSAPSPIPYDSGQVNPPSSGSFDQNIHRDQLSRVPSTDKTGPETNWVILFSFVFAYFLYHHKRKIVQKNNVN